MIDNITATTRELIDDRVGELTLEREPNRHVCLDGRTAGESTLRSPLKTLNLHFGRVNAPYGFGIRHRHDLIAGCWLTGRLQTAVFHG